MASITGILLRFIQATCYYFSTVFYDEEGNEYV